MIRKIDLYTPIYILDMVLSMNNRKIDVKKLNKNMVVMGIEDDNKMPILW